MKNSIIIRGRYKINRIIVEIFIKNRGIYMAKIKKSILTISLGISIIVGGMSYGVYWAFYDIQRINGQEYITESTSSNGAYTVIAYLNDGGATTGYSVLGTLKDNNSGKTKNIYWQYNCEKAEILWINDETIKINGIQLNVKDEIYDFRRE